MLFFFSLLQNFFPMMSSQQLIQRLYPYKSILGKDGHTAVEGVLNVSSNYLKFDLCVVLLTVDTL